MISSNKLYRKKLRNTILTGLLLVGNYAFSQGIGIGTLSPHPSALLDVDVSSLPANQKKGMLFPRIALQNRMDTTTIPNPAVGLFVYNTVNSATDTQIRADVFYYWTGTSWVDIATSKTFETELYPQVFIVANRGNQELNKTDFNNGASAVVTFDPAGTGAMSVDVGNRVSLSNNNFRILSGGNYEITGYVGYNPWVSTTCTTQATESTCIAALDLIVQVSTDNGVNWTNISKSSSIWGVGTGDRNRSVIIAPFVVNLAENSLVRTVIAKGSAINHGTSPSGSVLNIESGTGLAYSRLLRFQKIN
ncbi:hypothetical protein SD427_08300 [Chryseobacterium sp. JJR-5R]|uniref:hypothetical protein n=1 Tax=Chryseobacterium sp. JJR-5R TaxID=3093923 RepID=UPI002A74D104|nr:hypothetical protein [Chryseobacterium sp. JJR-5R]WPO84323.1 hypothetical protein SD427_08300 [Chryseobacterium sp. JJR-5R]